MLEIDGVDGVARVNWETEIIVKAGNDDPPAFNADFELDHFEKSIPCFKVTCTYVHIDDPSVATTEFLIDLCLKQFESKQKFNQDESPSSKKIKMSSNKVYDSMVYKRPCSVWVNLNGGEKKLLRVDPHPELDINREQMAVYTVRSWSEQFMVEYTSDDIEDNCIDPYCYSVPLTGVIWMKFDNNDHSEMNLIKHLTNIFAHQSNCDVQFCFNGGRKIGGHATILAARSTVFAAMFKHNMQESKTGEVVIQDINPEIFNDLLHYIYSGQTLVPLNENTVQPIFMAADKYNIEDLKEDCASFLFSQMRPTNALDLMVWAHLHSFDKIKEGALKFVTTNAKVIFKSDEWEKFITAHPDLCLLITRRLQ